MPTNHTRSIGRAAPIARRAPVLVRPAATRARAATRFSLANVLRAFIPWSAKKRPGAPLAARYLLHFQEPTWSSAAAATGATVGRNQAWLMNTLPSQSAIMAKLNTSVGHLALQGTTLTAFDLQNGARIVFVYVRRNTEGMPSWKRIVPPAKSFWPTQLTTIATPGSAWQVTTSSPWM